MIKHGFILDADYIRFLENNSDSLKAHDEQTLIKAIGRSSEIKAAVVSEDEKESQLRIILNYGHTIAHGLETATGYSRMLHGEAVAIGMMGAAKIAARLEILTSDDVEYHQHLLNLFGFDLKCPGIDPNAVIRAIEVDKKMQTRAIRWVLLEKIGQTVIRKDVSPDLVRVVVENLVI